MSAGGTLRELLRAKPAEGAILPEIDPASTPGIKDRSHAEDETGDLAKKMGELQERLFVEGARPLLVILQAMDTGGKDGTIAHVFRAMNPAGVDVATFKAPTEEERAHGFLWRIRRRLPAPGQVIIFNRSHYEDVLVPRVHELVPEDVWSARYEQINAFEAEVVAAGTVIVKLFLHISYEEQRERLLARLDDPSKHWTFDVRDLDERARWLDYQAAYEDAIARCHTPDAPWYVIPADHKWYRNRAVATLIVETLEAMDPQYPPPDLDVDALRARLLPST
jgi:PPK2 family polyphosphate:nucleotide phosphotransferase